MKSLISGRWVNEFQDVNVTGGHFGNSQMLLLFIINESLVNADANARKEDNGVRVIFYRNDS